MEVTLSVGADVIDQLQRRFSLLEAARHVGRHPTVAYGWFHRSYESGCATFEQLPNLPL